MYSFRNFSSKYDPLSSAYWVSPKGEIIEPHFRHIGSIIEHPKLFGETEESLAATYAEYGEQMSPTVEGKAREEVMLRVLKRGFIRVREVRHTWTVQVEKTDRQTKENIWIWAKMVLKKDPNRKFDDVLILQLKGNKKQKINLQMLTGYDDLIENWEERIKVIKEKDLASLYE